MGSRININNRVFNVTENIMISIDDNNIGDLYVYDQEDGYVLNGATASELINFFYENNQPLSEEIMDALMDMPLILMET